MNEKIIEANQKFSADLNNLRIHLDISDREKICLLCDKPISPGKIHASIISGQYKGHFNFRGVHIECYKEKTKQWVEEAEKIIKNI